MKLILKSSTLATIIIVLSFFITTIWAEGQELYVIGGGRSRLGVPKTGQTISYRYGDDGTYQKGLPSGKSRFSSDVGASVVTDNITGLMWTKNANLLGTNWNAAVDYCLALNYGGYDDWRLPNSAELVSLLGLGVPPGIFVDVKNSYWSSTTCAHNSDYAYSYINYSFVPLVKTYLCLVWPVRGGQ